MFGEIDRGELTDKEHEKLCYGKIFLYDDCIGDIQGTEALDERSAFLEGLISTLNQKGFKCEEKDTDKILDEIKQRYKERLGCKCPRTVQDWIKGETPPGVTNRQNNYDLCYALEMDLKETAEFFIKHYLTLPFNYKDRMDAIFFYCLSHERPYSVVQRMLSESKGYKMNTENSEATVQIGRHIREIDNDDEFMDFLKHHCYSDEQQYKAVRKEIISLIEMYIDEKEGIAGLTRKVMGSMESKNKLTKIRKLPKGFTKCLPDQRTFGDIRKGKKETYVTMRKAFIILYFYDFYMQKREKRVEEKTEKETEQGIRDDLLDFYEEVNDKLINFGFAPLYERNPFDWLILRCTTYACPIEIFHSLYEMPYEED